MRSIRIFTIQTNIDIFGDEFYYKRLFHIILEQPLSIVFCFCITFFMKPFFIVVT